MDFRFRAKSGRAADITTNSRDFVSVSVMRLGSDARVRARHGSSWKRPGGRTCADASGLRFQTDTYQGLDRLDGIWGHAPMEVEILRN
jgi:hypothetical protein